MFIDLVTADPVTRQNYLQAAIGPRPICFASTINSAGQVNLSPFSFFNMFSTTPPVIIFSPSRRLRNNTTKHTLHNVKEVKEVGVNMVDESMIEQVSLASCDYPDGVNEFLKSGFTQMPSTRIAPPLVKESKVKMECVVRNIIALGENAGAGNLVICEVLCMHIEEDILNADRQIDQQKLHHVARLGGNWYCRVDAGNLFEVEKPNVKIGIGVDALPLYIRSSRVLSGNHLGRLGNVTEIPVIDPGFEDAHLHQILQYFSMNPEDLEQEMQRYAGKLLDAGKVNEAWQVLLSIGHP